MSVYAMMAGFHEAIKWSVPDGYVSASGGVQKFLNFARGARRPAYPTTSADGAIAASLLLPCDLGERADRLAFIGMKVRPHGAGRADPPPFAHHRPFAEQRRDGGHGVEPLLVRLGHNLLQIGSVGKEQQLQGLTAHAHILAAMSCSSLPTAST